MYSNSNNILILARSQFLNHAKFLCGLILWYLSIFRINFIVSVMIYFTIIKALYVCSDNLLISACNLASNSSRNQRDC